jgi:tetratricopeptide (TPR) repeat protein
MNSYRTKSEMYFEWGFNLFWSSQKLPVKMDLFLQIYIRILQIMLHLDKGKNTSFLEEDLASITLASVKRGINVGPAAILLSSIYAPKDPKKAIEFFSLGVRDFDKLQNVKEIEKELSASFAPEQMVWSATIGIKTKEEVDYWFSIFEGLTQEQRFNSLESELIHFGCLVIGRNLIAEEEKKEIENQNWEQVLREINIIENKAQQLGIDLLVANFVRYKIIIYAKKLGMIDKAFQLFESESVFLANEPTIQFLVKDSIGKQLFYNGRYEDALPLIAEAVSLEVNDVYTEKLDTLLIMAQLLGQKDEKAAEYYTKIAYKLAVNNKYYSEVDQAKVVGELAVSYWLNKDLKSAIYLLGEGYEAIMASYSNSDEFNAAIIRYGHVLNYFKAKIEGDRLPEIGGEPYVPPFRGFFFRTNEMLLEGNFFFEERLFATPYLFVSCFEAYSDYENSKKWAFKSKSFSNNLPFNVFYPLLHSVTPYLIIENKYDEAISQVASIIEVTNKIADDKIPLAELVTNENLRRVIGNRPKKRIDSYDEVILEFAILPLSLFIFSSYISSAGDSKISFINELIRIIMRWENLFTNQNIPPVLRAILSELGTAEVKSEKIVSIANQYDEELAPTIKTLGYLAASLNGPTHEALKAHLAVVNRLETVTLKLSKGTYNFILMPFFEKFWQARFEEKPKDFSDADFWVSRSLPYYRKAQGKEKLRKLFKILCHHLNHEPSYAEASWID